MFRLLFLSLIFTAVLVAQQKPTVGPVEVIEVKDTARYYYYYSPRFHTVIVDYDNYDAWFTYVIDSTYHPGTERFPDGTYKRWKRSSNGKLLTMVRIAPKAMREILFTDTATYRPHWMGEIPRREVVREMQVREVERLTEEIEKKINR